MKRVVMVCLMAVLFSTFTASARAKTINETDTTLCEAYKLALIRSLAAPVEEAIEKIYKQDPDAPEQLSWDAFSTEVMEMKQVHGVGGSYEVTLLIKPYYRAHITYGEDQVVVTTEGELVAFTHIKTYPKIEVHAGGSESDQAFLTSED